MPSCVETETAEFCSGHLLPASQTTVKSLSQLDHPQITVTIIPLLLPGICHYQITVTVRSASLSHLCQSLTVKSWFYRGKAEQISDVPPSSSSPSPNFSIILPRPYTPLSFLINLSVYVVDNQGQVGDQGHGHFMRGNTRDLFCSVSVEFILCMKCVQYMISEMLLLRGVVRTFRAFLSCENVFINIAG